jgi:hypothetical protein
MAAAVERDVDRVSKWSQRVPPLMHTARFTGSYSGWLRSETYLGKVRPITSDHREPFICYDPGSNERLGARYGAVSDGDPSAGDAGERFHLSDGVNRCRESKNFRP